MMNPFSRLFCFAGLLIAGVSVQSSAQRLAITGEPPPRPADSVRPRTPADSLTRVALPRIPPRRRFWVENTFTNVYDSNIEHDSTNVGAYGAIAGARTWYRSRSTNPAVQLEYAGAVHEYTATDRFDRVSHLGRAGVDFPLSDFLSTGLTLEAFLKGSSEDREIGDQLAVYPRIELKPMRDVRLRLIGAYRKRYFDTETSNATNRYINGDARVRFGVSTIEAAARFEENKPQLARLRFQRQTYSARYIRELSDRDEILFGLEYRPVKYPERFVEIEVPTRTSNSGPGRGDDDERDPTPTPTIIEVQRRDTRWKPQFVWTREWWRYLRTELEYEYEIRDSTDPEKRYRGHVVTLTTAIPWYR